MTLRSFAEGFIALANSNQKKAEVSAALARKSLSRVSLKYQKQVEAAWNQANKKALGLLVLVMKNNPHKTKDQILKRPDVQAVLRKPYEEAAKKSEAILREAWGAAEKDAVQKTKGEFKLLGVKWEGHTVDEALLESLVGDLHANAKAMRERYSEAMSDPERAQHRLGVVASDATRRGSYSVSTGVWGVSTQVRDSAIAYAGLNKMWVAVLDGDTCSHCEALHGTVVGPKEQFPKTAGKGKLKVYMGVLFGPPRHPNCRCILVGTKLQKTK